MEANSYKKFNTWNELKKFYNQRFNQIITRQEYQKGIPGKMHSKDSYTRYLVASGFLKHISTARYHVFKMIPDSLTSTFVRVLAYDTETELWIFWIDQKEKVMEDSEKMRMQLLENPESLPQIIMKELRMEI